MTAADPAVPARPAAGRSREHRGWVIGAYVALALALVGLALPVVPTVPFVLLAAWMAARGSPRLHRWLRQHRHFGRVVRAWEDEGAVPRRAKWIATATMTAGAVFLLVWSPLRWMAWTITGIMAVVAVYLWTRPEPSADTHPR